ncbi:hypothetical protein F2Q68_00013208 [Brassica cretica]|uniref:Uncharacterized protein n=1 Tax=Brassica cretica TaxID=69181 RepID=A0A8S9HH41_BRACR|nr:hypothetical protein F2Q68_00013208 [Brassica cretica]
MGCCISATATATATTDKKNEPVSGKKTALPPVAVVEEETVVKEVLSETTLVTSLNDNSAMETTTNKVPEEEEEEEEKKPGAVDASPDPVLTENGSVEPGKGSEVSEICSLSESLLSIVSGYEEEEVKQMKPQGVRQRSPAKYRDRVMANNYPTRRSDMSPRKRNTEGGEGAGSVRLVPSGAGQRDPTERSERRRSRSPAINRPVMVGPSRNHYVSTDNGGVMMKKGQSPGRVRPYPNKNGSEQDCHRQWPSQNDNSTSNDSFENPLVSLECFIFL